MISIIKNVLGKILASAIIASVLYFFVCMVIKIAMSPEYRPSIHGYMSIFLIVWVTVVLADFLKMAED